MPCPYCGAKETQVAEALWDDHYKTVRRLRRCPKCDYRWDTVEVDYDQIRSLEDKALPSWREEKA